MLVYRIGIQKEQLDAQQTLNTKKVLGNWQFLTPYKIASTHVKLKPFYTGAEMVFDSIEIRGEGRNSVLVAVDKELDRETPLDVEDINVGYGSAPTKVTVTSRLTTHTSRKTFESDKEAKAFADDILRKASQVNRAQYGLPT